MSWHHLSRLVRQPRYQNKVFLAITVLLTFALIHLILYKYAINKYGAVVELNKQFDTVKTSSSSNIEASANISSYNNSLLPSLKHALYNEKLLKTRQMSRGKFGQHSIPKCQYLFTSTQTSKPFVINVPKMPVIRRENGTEKEVFTGISSDDVDLITIRQGSFYKYQHGVNPESTKKQEKPCKIHEYDLLEIRRCIDQRVDADLPSSIQFWGDSRVRNRFNALLWLLQDLVLSVSIGSVNSTKNEDRVWISSRDYLTVPRKIHQDILAVSTRHPNLKMVFRWMPYIDNLVSSKLINELETLQAFRNSSSLAILVLGCGTWYLQRARTSGQLLRVLVNYKLFLGSLKPFLQMFTSSSAALVIWQLQDPVMDEHKHKGDVTAINEENVQLLNKIVLHELGNSGVWFWNSTQPLSRRYMEICRQSRNSGGDKNNMVPNVNLLESALWNCGDHIHLGFSFLVEFVQLIVNAMCNDMTDSEADTKIITRENSSLPRCKCDMAYS